MLPFSLSASTRRKSGSELPKPVSSTVKTTIKSTLKSLIPPSLDLPLRYYGMKIRGRLDDELALLPTRIRDRTGAINVGANIGFYSYALSKIFRDVEAFEPISECTSMLRAYGHNISVHNVALSNLTGEATLHIPTMPDGSINGGLASLEVISGIKRLVPLRRLDEYVFSRRQLH